MARGAYGANAAALPGARALAGAVRSWSERAGWVGWVAGPSSGAPRIRVVTLATLERSGARVGGAHGRPAARARRVVAARLDSMGMAGWGWVAAGGGRAAAAAGEGHKVAGAALLPH